MSSQPPSLIDTLRALDQEWKADNWPHDDEPRPRSYYDVAADRISELEAAIRISAERWQDFGDIFKEEGQYDNVAFCHASARRCQDALLSKYETTT